MTADELIAEARRLGEPSPGDGWRRLLWQLADALEAERQTNTRRRPMGIAIRSMTTTNGGEWVSLETEDGERIVARIVASNGGYTIAHYDDADRWHAIEITDFGDGSAEFYEHAEGDTFDEEYRDQYVVRKTDSAGSLKWVEVGGGGE